MRVIFAFASLAVLAGCVAPSAPPPAPARPVPVPAPAPASAPAPPPPASSDWRDWPLTPGNWVYRKERHGSSANYGALTVQCDSMGRQIALWLRGATAEQMVVRTSSTARTLTTQPGKGEPGVLASLPANDSLLDAMGYSRGRFIVETPGAPPLVVPAWSEVLRVVEDCRG